MPYFSIIVPVYNVAPYLREALDSVLAQTFTDWECICVDDGSTDGSGAILDEYAAKDTCFKVFHKENGGVSSARNLGIDHAQGQYLSFLDPDDILMPERLAVAHQILTEKKVDLLRLKLTVWREGDNVNYNPTVEGVLYSTQDEVLKWGVPTLLKEGWAPPLFIRKEGVPPSVRFPVGMKMREDNIFSMRLLKVVRSAYEGEDRGYLYRQWHGSAIRFNRTLDDAIRFADELSLLWRDYHCFNDDFSYVLTGDIMWYLFFLKKGAPFAKRCQYCQALARATASGLKISKHVSLHIRFMIFCFRTFKIMWLAPFFTWLYWVIGFGKR